MPTLQAGKVVGGLLVAGAALLVAHAGLRTPSADGAARVDRGLIVFHQGTDAGPGGDALGAIWTTRPDGSGVRRLRGPCTDCYSSPRLSPDGTRIAYADYAPSGATAVFVMKRDGTGATMLCVGRCLYPVAWSPDGRRLVVGTESGSLNGPEFGYGVLDLKTRRLHPFPKLPPAFPRLPSSLDWSPDGKQILAADGASYKLWLMRSDGTGGRLLADNVLDARWSADSKTLLLSDSEGSAIYTMPVGGGKRTLIRRVAARSALSVAWSPDERQIAYAGVGLYVLDVASGRSRRLDARTHICSKAGGNEGAGRTYCHDVDWRG
jgi:TolB protein